MLSFILLNISLHRSLVALVVRLNDDDGRLMMMMMNHEASSNYSSTLSAFLAKAAGARVRCVFSSKAAPST